jgi:hypothetical protein
MTRAAKQLPDDVEPGQLWKDPDGQHYRVLRVSGGGVVAMHRATPAGRVHNTRFEVRETLEKMQSEWTRVSG